MKIKEFLSEGRAAINDLAKGKGRIFIISGESGFGKTYYLQKLQDEANLMSNSIKVSYSSAQAPIGKFNLGNIQPLLPFSRSIEYLMTNWEMSAEKRFAKNVLMTTLASLPLVDSVFYFVKETAKDWREFKKEKSSEKSSKLSTASADYYDTIVSLANKKPLILLLDDMHWCDAQSVELLGQFARNIGELPIIIALTFKETSLTSHGMPLYSFYLKYNSNSEAISRIQLNPFEQAELGRLCSVTLPNYKPNSQFEAWLFERSFGVPAIVFEYLKYFKERAPIRPDGTFDTELAEDYYLPANAQAAFSQLLEKISEEERNILSVCSAEGKEFTAVILSKLLSTDVLTTIKKLRSIQHKTGLIRSIGPQVRYGLKTTAYQFTQAFYHSFFEKSLEYEEHIALHGQIASLLKKEFENSSEEVREQIAPYLAAHSAESGDEETARSMMLVTAQAASKYGSSEIIREAYENFVNFGSISSEGGNQEGALGSDDIEFSELMSMANGGIKSENNVETSPSNDAESQQILPVVDYDTLRKAIIKEFLSNDFEASARMAVNYLENHKEKLSIHERTELICFVLRADSESGRFDRLKDLESDAKELLKGEIDTTHICLILNTLAIASHTSGNYEEAMSYLMDAAEKIGDLPEEMKLLTLTNIGLIMKEKNPGQAEKYLNAARKMSMNLDFESF